MRRKPADSEMADFIAIFHKNATICEAWKDISYRSLLLATWTIAKNPKIE